MSQGIRRDLDKKANYSTDFDRFGVNFKECVIYLP